MTAERRILHVDMDAFFASVEVLLDPSLVGKPVIVGGKGARGVVAACTYEARMFGVRSAMPSVQARRICPQAVWLAPRFEHYTDYSTRLHEILDRYSPLVEGISLDEAFVDVTGARRLLGTGEEIAWRIRETIDAELALHASVGVAASKFVAKLASEAAKPSADRRGVRAGAGVFVVAPGTELDFLHPLPVRALWGVGPATLERLERFGIATVGDLAAMPRDSLVAALGPAVGSHLHELAWARDTRRVEPHRPIKSVSHEETYAHDLHDHAELAREALRMADAVAARLRRASLTARTVTVKVRFHDFATITRSQTLSDPVDTTQVIARTAAALLAQIDPTPGVRLLGVGVSNLSEDAARQLSLLAPPDEWAEASDAVDRIRDRYGAGAVGPAALLGRGRPFPGPPR
ncbi:MAG: DNA polymerase IV [Acidimicrobiales bacterium]